MKLSVIIPTHNRDETLGKTLSALADQTLSRDDFEVLVVDDGSDEDHRCRTRSYDPPFNYTLLEKPQGGLASARNFGADRARGAILHFLDDDVVPEADTLSQHLASHDHESGPVAVVGSLPYPPEIELSPFLRYLEHVGHYDLYKNPHKYPEGRPPMPPLNGNSSVARDVFFEIGRYDERFRQYGSEDLELGYRLAKAGVRFVYNPRAVGYHHHIKDFPQFCIDMETAGESLIHLYVKYPEIKAAKKIDVLEDRLRDLPGKKRIVKIVMSTTFGAPWILGVPRWIIRRVEPIRALAPALFPLYRWVAHYHYALGMQRGLASVK